jgi:AraC family transcriptional regulator
MNLVPSSNRIFTARETHGRVLRAGNRLIAHSEEIGWRSLYAAIIEEAPFDMVEPAVHNPSLIYHLSQPTVVVRKVDGICRDRALIGPRRICLTPSEATVRWQHSGHPEILQIYLRQSIYDAAVSEMYDCDPVSAQIVPRFAILDPLLEQLALAITAALRDGTSDDVLYIETLSQMIAVQLARHHSVRSRNPRMATSSQKLPAWKMKRLIDYIEEHLDSNLSLDAMAKELQISALYLPRVFKTAVGQSPHQYVLGRRIERAKNLLRNTDSPIADVALSSGFSSQSHLSNWFLRLVGIPPAVYRRQSET